MFQQPLLRQNFCRQKVKIFETKYFKTIDQFSFVPTFYLWCPYFNTTNSNEFLISSPIVIYSFINGDEI